MTAIVPFNGDHHIGEKITELVRAYNIRTIVETGTWSGHTTRFLATLGPKVITIDSTWEHIFEEFGVEGLRDMNMLGILAVLGDSSKELARIIGGVPNSIEHPALFYLDAHGGGANGSNVNPLESEFRQIASSEKCLNSCVIVVHDFQVPGKEWGHNWGGWGLSGEALPLSYDVIKPWVESVYPDGYAYHYNEKADGACRGVIYIYPKEML